MKFGEWVQEHGYLIAAGYGSTKEDLTTILNQETTVLAWVIDKREDPCPGLSWKRSFILLTQSKLVIGHAAYRIPTEEDVREGVEFISTVVPTHSIATVSFETFETRTKGWSEKASSYTVEFNNGRPSLVLPPDTSGKAENAYLTLGQYLVSYAS